ncbi:MAG: extracellular solute-binding protein [Lachnospiraceae bacterium]|nr:extracellular solute-binding protein [Lachnospiraceae bacterium]
MRKKTILLIVCVILAVLGLTGCKSGGDGAGNTDYKNYVYKVSDLEQPDPENGIGQLLKAGDTFYATSYQWSDDGTGAYLVFYEMAEDGTFDKEYRIEMGNYNNFSGMVLDEQANLYCINNIYGPIEGTDEYEDAYFLEKRTLEGEVIFSVKLNDVPQLKELADEYFYVGNMIMIPEQGIYISILGDIAKFDLEGNFVQMITGVDPESQSAFEGGMLIPIADGRTVAVMYEETGMWVAFVDLEKGTIVGEKCKIPGNSYEYSLYAGIGYDLYLVSSYGVYGYNVGDTDKTQLMSYIDSDCGFYNVFNLVPISETEFIGMYNSIDLGDQMLARFTKVPPEEVKEKQVITLACTGTDYEITKAVVTFNKENENYRISVQDYSSMYSTEEDYSAGVTRLNTDIISGKVPDIIILDSRMPVDSYISKGLFEDLKPYIENDSEMSLDDFMPNIIEAYSVDGKLYRLVPSYSIQTVVAKASDVGKERGWTVEEAMDIWQSKPEGTEFLSHISRDSMLWYCMSMSGGQFIDWDTGKCNFNTDEFARMLEFVAMFPEEVNQATFDDEYWLNYDSMWREGKVLASLTSVGDFRNYNYIEKGTFGEDITMIGFPSADGDGSAIMANREFAMSSKSSYKEGVWEFLRTFLLDEYQGSSNNWGFPLSIKHLDLMGEEAMKRPSYEDEMGNVIEYDDTYYISDMEVVIEPMTAEEVEEFKEQLYSFKQRYNNDENLLNIIKEEAAAYFSGQKKAKDVADIIQSRVQIYVNETR